MCSILFTRTKTPLHNDVVSRANRLQKLCGPDNTGKKVFVDRHGYHLSFLHNLLDVSGHGIFQPVDFTVNESRATLLFSGELYGYDKNSYQSDTEYLLWMIKQNKALLPTSLDGEYVIVLYKSATDELSVITDTFLTKPLYFGSKTEGADFALSTYASCLQYLGFDKIEMASPNTFYNFAFHQNDYSVEKYSDVAIFKLDQYQTDYEPWVNAFLRAVKKRATHGALPPFVPLSSGYDSGAICLALNLLGIKYETFTIDSNESSSVINARIEINTSFSCTQAHVFPQLSRKITRRLKEDIETNVEPFLYVHEDAPEVRINIAQDDGAVGLNFIASQASKSSKKVALSGAGGDEIYSDYGFQGKKHYYHSEFGGLFPDDFRHLFPWRKFYGDTQRSYLFKDEFILGRHGIEGRYPFLDVEVVQNFLSIQTRLKNAEYKAPIAYFLRKHGYPYESGIKKGFSPYTIRPSSILSRIRSFAAHLVKLLRNRQG